MSKGSTSLFLWHSSSSSSSKKRKVLFSLSRHVPVPVRKEKKTNLFIFFIICFAGWLGPHLFHLSWITLDTWLALYIFPHIWELICSHECVSLAAQQKALTECSPGAHFSFFVVRIVEWKTQQYATHLCSESKIKSFITTSQSKAYTSIWKWFAQLIPVEYKIKKKKNCVFLGLY